ncbi:hypothetical protein SHKM778_45050 [Streptomyces sp. KM77-8]|uniref:Transposase n=1 Tax=Streptomyces haneummycinicus TaxID=3074435 RepID=A0AAT9HL18_9ACTN
MVASGQYRHLDGTDSARLQDLPPNQDNDPAGHHRPTVCLTTSAGPLPVPSPHMDQNPSREKGPRKRTGSELVIEPLSLLLRAAAVTRCQRNLISAMW